MKISVPDLTNAEYELMSAIWKTEEPMSTNDIIKNLENGKDWKVTTVLTLMGKLIDKGYVRAIKTGRSYQYYVLVAKKQYQKSEGNLLLKKLYNNSIKNFIAALYEDDNLSEKDIRELREWFDEKCQ